MTDWIEWKWTPEKPYPETLETEVFLLYGDGSEGYADVGFLYDEEDDWSNWYPHTDGSQITHYRLASEDKE